MCETETKYINTHTHTYTHTQTELLSKYTTHVPTRMQMIFVLLRTKHETRKYITSDLTKFDVEFRRVNKKTNR